VKHARFFKKDVMCVIERDEADNIFKTGTVNYLVGRRIPLILIEKKGGVLYASRKKAQDQLLVRYEPDFVAKKEFVAQILSFTDYGAFISVRGVVGVIRNTDFSSDYTSIREVKKAGETLKVKFKTREANGNLYFEAVQKFHRKSAVKPDFAVGATRMGEVISVREFGLNSFVFVQLTPGLNVMAIVPYGMEVTPKVGTHKRVKVQITEIIEPKKLGEAYRVRGILRGVLS